MKFIFRKNLINRFTLHNPLIDTKNRKGFGENVEIKSGNNKHYFEFDRHLGSSSEVKITVNVTCTSIELEDFYRTAEFFFHNGSNRK